MCIRDRYQTASGVLPAGALFWVALAFLFAFAVKVPVFPLHGWLADTYNEAPVALAMVVAGKLGLYSMIRFHVGLFPAQARALAPVLIVLAVIGILYGACLALVQRDYWRLMAFAALSHLSLIVLAIYGLTLTGWSGAIYQILSHGVVDGCLLYTSACNAACACSLVSCDSCTTSSDTICPASLISASTVIPTAGGTSDLHVPSNMKGYCCPSTTTSPLPALVSRRILPRLVM